MRSCTKQVTGSERTSEQNDKQDIRGQGLSVWLRDHVYLASVIVLIASMVPRLFLTLSTDPEKLRFPDSGTYFSNAYSLLERGAVLNRKQEPEVSRTPGYPVFLLAIMVATGKRLTGEDLRTVLVLQTVITSWSVVFLYWLARRIVPPVMAFTGALLAAFFSLGCRDSRVCSQRRPVSSEPRSVVFCDVSCSRADNETFSSFHGWCLRRALDERRSVRETSLASCTTRRDRFICIVWRSPEKSLGFDGGHVDLLGLTLIPLESS